MNNIIDKFLEWSMHYVMNLEDLSAPLAINFNWVPASSLPSLGEGEHLEHNFISPLRLQYADGNSPWSFWLSYEPSTEYQALQLSLRYVFPFLHFNSGSFYCSVILGLNKKLVIIFPTI